MTSEISIHYAAFSAMFFTGLFSSVHCLTMCGGIASALQLGAPRHLNSWLVSILYSAGRILGYGVLGFAVGTLAWSVTTLAETRAALVVLRWFGALMIIAMAGYIGGWWHGIQWLERKGQQIFHPIQKFSGKLLPLKNAYQVFGVGLLWSALPCGLVYTALAQAASSASPKEAALRMVAFGSGTLPALLLTGQVANQLKRWLNKQAMKRLVSALLVLLAIWTLWPALGHGHSHHPHQHHGKHKPTMHHH